MDVEKIFKQGKTLQIKAFYVIMCTIVSYLLSSFLIYILNTAGLFN